ncbi:hypothetical protein ACJJTC_010517 [Scirpophaga incertulas]
MGKRKNSENRVERIEKKIRKLQRNLEKEDQEEGTPPGSPSVEAYDAEIEESDDIPEDLIAALGSEGEKEKKEGLPIQNELVKRWTNIMKSGISKESLDKLCTKYPVPDNFKGVIPPKMNPEIAASLSSITIKRDQRLINRQNITGKLLTAISNTMTNVMKGNINSKIIIEQLSDAAKLAAQTFYEDNSSRNFFALANTSLTIKNALRDSEPELYLFGTDCGEKSKIWLNNSKDWEYS